jgi:hypothetical protein
MVHDLPYFPRFIAKSLLALSFVVFATCYSRANAQAVWNIADHGAEPGSDVTEILRQGFATQHEHGLPVFIPGHMYKLSDTVTLPFRDGVAMAGVTVGSGFNPKSTLAGAGSRLVWTGRENRPMFIVTGSHVRVTGGLALIGKPPNTDQAPCRMAILVTKQGKGLGTGKMRIDWLLLEDFEVGIQFGLEPSETNCDEVAIDQLSLHNCQIAYRVTNSQSMGHRIGHVHAVATPVVFDFLGGGMLSVDSATMISGTLLRLQENDPRRLSPGVNNASFRLDEVKVDAQAGESFTLVDMHDPLTVDISSTGGRISGPASGTMAVLRGPASLVLRDWANLRDESLEIHAQQTAATTRTPHVLLDHCRLRGNADKLLSPASTAEPTLKLRGCYNAYAEPIE